MKKIDNKNFLRAAIVFWFVECVIFTCAVIAIENESILENTILGWLLLGILVVGVIAAFLGSYVIYDIHSKMPEYKVNLAWRNLDRETFSEVLSERSKKAKQNIVWDSVATAGKNVFLFACGMIYCAIVPVFPIALAVLLLSMARVYAIGYAFILYFLIRYMRMLRMATKYDYDKYFLFVPEDGEPRYDVKYGGATWPELRPHLKCPSSKGWDAVAEHRKEHPFI